MKRTKVYIYGLCNVHYDSFYIEGIKEIFSEIEFNILKFPNFIQGTFAFIVSENGCETKIIIDSRDTNEIDFETLRWCDRYGKVNYNEKSILTENREKLVAIGPSFGIKIWNLTQTISFVVSHLFKFKSRIKDKREFVANYWRQYKRLPLKDYKPEKSKRNEVFFISSIWQKEKTANNYRALFIEECIKYDELKFEGGFAPRNNRDNLGYDALVFSKRISIINYLSKIKKSAFVFNTPAVLSCHGWKLGEFLALGKAIISTPHKNMLPNLLEDNIHLVYAISSDDIARKIKILTTDLIFKKKIEIASRDYYEKNLQPKVVINKLLK